MDLSKETIDENNIGNLKDRRKVDTLLGCLVFLAKYHKRETSTESLTFGLALHNTSMNLKLFYQASERIGLIPKTVNRPKIKNISLLALPSVLLLDNERHCVL
ncbi:MAG: type I secretion system permease/ATPase, partial [Campylobacteraceae bacterium]|nr:type I secretion system permease/ATPase [Campylobacteraceae bacterium]